MSAEQKVVCETPTPDRKPTKIDAWKYELVANAILNLLKQSPEGILFKELPDLVRDRLADKANEVGSMS